MTAQLDVTIRGINLAEWMEKNHANIKIFCAAGYYHVTIKLRKKLNAGADRCGDRMEVRRIHRANDNLGVVLSDAVQAACDVLDGRTPRR